MRYTRIEREVLRLQQTMRPLTQKALQWVANEHDTQALYSKGGRVWCTRCGHIENVDPKILALDVETGYRCPACGKILKMRHDPRSRYNNSRVFAVIAQVVSGWQVFRAVESYISVAFGKEAYQEQHEVWQAWISPQGREVLLSRRYTRSPFAFRWHYDTPIEVPRRHNATTTGYYALPDTFSTMGAAFYPAGKIAPALRLRGFSRRLCCFDVEGCALRLFLPHMETLAKTQPALFAYLVKRGDFEVPFFHAVKVCNRNGYAIADASLWLDMCESLAAIGADTHNAYYVCPENLSEAHDAATRRRAAMLRKREKMEAERRMVEDDRLYKKEKKAFIGLSIEGNDLRVSVLPDVAAFRDEGKALSHCVFTNRYFAREDALILSARDVEGNRLETIEVSLKTFEIVQSRGRSNQPSARHAEIVTLVSNNMNMIKDRCLTR